MANLFEYKDDRTSTYLWFCRSQSAVTFQCLIYFDGDADFNSSSPIPIESFEKALADLRLHGECHIDWCDGDQLQMRSHHRGMLDIVFRRESKSVIILDVPLILEYEQCANANADVGLLSDTLVMQHEST